MDQIRLHVVHEGTSVYIRCHWPCHGVLNKTRLEVWISLCHFPYLFEPKTIVLRAYRIFVKLESLLQVLGKRAPRTLSKDGLFAEYSHAWFKVVFTSSIFANSK